MILALAGFRVTGRIGWPHPSGKNSSMTQIPDRLLKRAVERRKMLDALRGQGYGPGVKRTDLSLLDEIQHNMALDTIHTPYQCSGEPCCIHDPSEHTMRTWPMNLRETGLIERICPHGIGHPDPDSAAWMERATGQIDAWGVHGCDGCCHQPEPDLDAERDQVLKMIKEVEGR
jgi:hypothetical protein